MDNRAKHILQTLLYSDIFDYPLKKKEIYKYLPNGNFSKEKLSSVLITQKKIIENKNGYFFLKDRSDLYEKRKKRERESNLKLKKAEKIIKKISFIPTVKLIGISGALAMRNCDADDDIDVFVITENNFIWTTRFLMILILKVLGVYRGKQEREVSNKICLNMIIESSKSSFEKRNKNIFIAHEIIQMIPIYDKDDTYEKFINSNDWVKIFLPNAVPAKKILIKKRESAFDSFWIYIFKILFIERILYFIQFNYMKKNINKEVIQKGILGFHPFDYKTFILNKYKNKLREYNIEFDYNA